MTSPINTVQEKWKLLPAFLKVLPRPLQTPCLPDPHNHARKPARAPVLATVPTPVRQVLLTDAQT